MTNTNKVISERPYFYHSNHLGSSAWITNYLGTPVQSITYLPYGKEFINQQSTSYDAVYKFIGKERDSETGYDLLDNRYYSSDLGMFISTDPLAHLRSWMTPYNYSQNSPINRSDPSGLLDDEYKIDKSSGQITWQNNNKHTDAKGNEVDKLFNNNGESIDVTKGVLNQRQPFIEKYQSFSFPNSTEAEDFYHFSAENSDVEWTFAEKKQGFNSNVGTDYNNGHTTMPQKYEKNSGNSIIRMSHSHPTGLEGPSIEVGVAGNKGGDLYNAFHSKYNYQREVYNVQNRTIYGYGNDTYNKASRNSSNNYDYKKSRY